MRIYIFICVLTFFMVGCSSVDSGKNLQSEDTTDVADVIEEASLLDIYHWEDAKIKDIGYFPKFEDGAIVQNEDSVFFVYDGNKIIRIDKSSKEEKDILEFDVLKDKTIGGYICLAENELYIEYAGDIYSSDFDGNSLVKILSRSELEKSILEITNDEDYNYGDINGIRFYQGNLYLYLGLYLLRLDLKTKEIIKIAEPAYDSCFVQDSLYYIGFYGDVIYRVNLSTLERVPIVGEDNSDIKGEERYVLKHFEEVLEVDGNIYYVEMQSGKNCSIYRYYENREDEKIFDYEIGRNVFYQADSALSKVVCYYLFFDENDNDYKRKLKIYDIKTSVVDEIETPIDFGDTSFITDNILFYSKGEDAPNIEYLSFLELPK